MMNFTEKANQSHLLSNSIISTSTITNASTITSTSSISGTSSIISAESTVSIHSQSDPYSLSFITDNQNYYHQLLDDLSIVDDLADTFRQEPDSVVFEKQVLDVARYVASKENVLECVMRTEVDYVNELLAFHEVYALRVQPWLENSVDKDIIAKFKETPLKQVFDAMFENIHDIAQAHSSFLSELKERIRLWGPTQLVSDVFYNLHESFAVYKPFMKQHNSYVMVVDTLYKIPAFTKLLETIMAENKQQNLAVKINDFAHYIQTPLLRFTAYSKALKQLNHYTNQAHPDFNSLTNVLKKFKALESEWIKKVHDCQSHLMVFEAYRSIQNCPINVNPQRRLLLFAHLIRVDLDDITSTSDIRMYFLYNDNLIYCKKKQKESKKDPADKKLVYKGTLSLRGAEIRQLAPAFCAKMCEEKKSLFRLGKKNHSDSNSLPGTEAFGFELVATELNLDAMSPLHQNYMSASASSGAPIKRRHVMRTRSKEEQATWYDTIRKAIAYTNAQPA